MRRGEVLPFFQPQARFGLAQGPAQGGGDGRVGGNDEIAIIFLHVRQQGGGQAGRDGIAALRAAVTHGRADGSLESPGRIAAPQRIADGRQPAPL